MIRFEDGLLSLLDLVCRVGCVLTCVDRTWWMTPARAGSWAEVRCIWEMAVYVEGSLCNRMVLSTEGHARRR
jgi:hypothetical protein